MAEKAEWLLNLEQCRSDSSLVGLRDAVLKQRRATIDLSRQGLYLQIGSRLTPAPGSHTVQWIRGTSGHVGLCCMPTCDLVWWETGHTCE